MGHFPDFLAIFQYSFGEPWHATYHFRIFFSNNFDGNKYISFKDHHGPRGYFGPILDDRLKEKLLNPWKGALSSQFRVCPSVRPLAGYRSHL